MCANVPPVSLNLRTVISCQFGDRTRDRETLSRQIRHFIADLSVAKSLLVHLPQVFVAGQRAYQI
ncbi:hypothetical protein AN416_21690 [Paraburkholderia caribensis]|jgi:hypothetical protein|nr:hypothetical protein AN416_21690 [Paraburkholderia caribensis]